MRTLNRNKSPFWYLLYDSKVPAKDEYGNETGEELVVYKPAVVMNANISAATGSAQVEQFGNFAGYDKVIVTDDRAALLTRIPCCSLTKNRSMTRAGNLSTITWSSGSPSPSIPFPMRSVR